MVDTNELLQQQLSAIEQACLDLYARSSALIREQQRQTEIQRDLASGARSDATAAGARADQSEQMLASLIVAIKCGDDAARDELIQQAEKALSLGRDNDELRERTLQWLSQDTQDDG